MKNIRVDSHHHLWHYTPQEFPWIGEKETVLRRDFGIRELQTALESAGISGTVVVQARQSMEETDSLLRLAGEENPILGVTGWLPLASPDIEGHLEAYAADPGLKGIRHVVQDEPDDDFILGKEFNRGVDLLADYGLVYEILVFQRHLPNTIEFVHRHPDQPLVLDHCGKPRIREGEFEEWAAGIRTLASFQNLSCKLSGLVTEADPRSWSIEELTPYAETVLEAFGPERLMFGSDWPVCLLGTGYDQWVQAAEAMLTGLSADEHSRIMGGTAAEVYGLSAE